MKNKKGGKLNYQKKNAYQIIEESFARFKTNRTVTEEEMKKKFGKYV
ncbi:hypothetical protein [Tetragenococcus halophilus]|nr:hypothetical protein [Tetragenococcus halophilus]GFK29294.1 hypothetical protein YG2_17280 [Tetragenococcus halophilus]